VVVGAGAAPPLPLGRIVIGGAPPAPVAVEVAVVVGAAVAVVVGRGAAVEGGGVCTVEGGGAVIVGAAVKGIPEGIGIPLGSTPGTFTTVPISWGGGCGGGSSLVLLSRVAM
jgi:hypothetical protein